MIKYSDIKTLLKRITRDEDANFDMKKAEIDVVRDSLYSTISLNSKMAHECDALQEMERRAEVAMKKPGGLSDDFSARLDEKYDEMESLRLTLVHNLEAVNTLFEKFDMKARFEVNEDSDYLEVAREVEDLSIGMIRNGAENIMDVFKNKNLTLSEQEETRKGLQKVDNLISNANEDVASQIQKERALEEAETEEKDSGYTSRFVKEEDELVFSI